MGDYVDHYIDADGSVVLTANEPAGKGNWTDDERLAILADIRHLTVIRDSFNPNHDQVHIDKYQRFIDAQTHALEAFTSRFSS